MEKIEKKERQDSKSENVDKKRETGKESFEDKISKCDSFDGVYRALLHIYRGKREEYVSTIKLIDDLKSGELNIRYTFLITDNFGLRNKVEELLGIDDLKDKDKDINKPELSQIKFGDLTDKEQIYLHTEKANKRLGGYYQDWNFITKEDLKKLEKWEGSDIEEVVKFADLSDEEQIFLHTYKANKRLGGYYQDWHQVSKEDLVLLKDWKNGKLEEKDEENSNSDSSEQEDVEENIKSENVDTEESFGDEEVENVTPEVLTIKDQNKTTSKEGDIADTEFEEIEVLPPESEAEDGEGEESPGEEVVIDIEAEVVDEVEILSSLVESRENYIKEHKKYLSNRKKKGTLSKLVEHLGLGKKEDKEDLPESLVKAKEEYDVAKVEYGKSRKESLIKESKEQKIGKIFGYDIGQEKLLELNRQILLGNLKDKGLTQFIYASNSLPEEAINWLKENNHFTDDQINEMKESSELVEGEEKMINSVVFDEVFLREYEIIKQSEAESWTPKEKGILRKGFDGWRKMGSVKRIAASFGLLAVGTGLAASGFGVLGAGVLFGRSFLGSIPSAYLGGSLFEKFVKDKSDIKRDERLNKLRLFSINNDINLENLQKGEAFQKKVEESYLRDKRERQVAKVVTMAASGLFGMLGARALSSWISGPGETATDLSEPKISPNTSNEVPKIELKPEPQIPEEPVIKIVPDSAVTAVDPDFGASLNPEIPEPVDPGTFDSSDYEYENPSPEFETDLNVIEPNSNELKSFEKLHGTEFDPNSPLDQAKMDITRTLSSAGITGVDGGVQIPSPMVDRVINSIIDSSDVSGWQKYSEVLKNPSVLEKIKSLQEQALINPSFVSTAEEQIKNLLLNN